MSNVDNNSDEHHTMEELYEYRMAYNALLFNEWSRQGVNNVHKSWRHSDGELCFGGGWFIVSANTPYGQITNHYPEKDWGRFVIPEREFANEWDGHDSETALNRMKKLIAIY